MVAEYKTNIQISVVLLYISIHNKKIKTFIRASEISNK